VYLTKYDIINEDILDIKEIIMHKNLEVCFQPVICMSRKMVSGYEGLIRGVSKDHQRSIPPITLFQAAHDEGLKTELDRVCRERVLEGFQSYHHQNTDKLLFLNVDASILDRVEGSNYLINQVKKYDINPKNIVIEINETKVQENTALKRFTDTYRKRGFMVAIDDVGTGFSNMDRILLVKPDIIKIDISLVRGIQHDYYKQEVFKSLVNLCNTIGTLVIAEGVETEQEAIEILRLGGQMIQGYVFAKPQKIHSNSQSDSTILRKIEMLSKSFNQYMKQNIQEEKNKGKSLNKIVDQSIKELKKVSSHEFDKELLSIIWANKTIGCAYVLDEFGIQISNTIRLCDRNEVNDNLIFYSASVGSDHSMKKYYYPLVSAGIEKYITDPYVSLATGDLCITISSVFINKDHTKNILCMDFNVNKDSCEFEFMKDLTKTNLLRHNASIPTMNDMLAKMNERMNKDSLTNAYNRYYLEERLLVEIADSSNKKPLSIILTDIDYFKEVNDRYGHLAGDFVLKEFVKIVRQRIRRDTDWIARYGGEEFLIVLNNADKHIAYSVAESVRKAIEKAKIVYNDEPISITASFGIYTITSEIMTYEQLIGHADKNLYFAKKSGRNKICK